MELEVVRVVVEVVRGLVVEEVVVGLWVELVVRRIVVGRGA